MCVEQQPGGLPQQCFTVEKPCLPGVISHHLTLPWVSSLLVVVSEYHEWNEFPYQMLNVYLVTLTFLSMRPALLVSSATQLLNTTLKSTVIGFTQWIILGFNVSNLGTIKPTGTLMGLIVRLWLLSNDQITSEYRCGDCSEFSFVRHGVTDFTSALVKIPTYLILNISCLESWGRFQGL